jgi:hypothetical protein
VVFEARGKVENVDHSGSLGSSTIVKRKGSKRSVVLEPNTSFLILLALVPRSS